MAQICITTAGATIFTMEPTLGGVNTTQGNLTQGAIVLVPDGTIVNGNIPPFTIMLYMFGSNQGFAKKFMYSQAPINVSIGTIDTED